MKDENNLLIKLQKINVSRGHLFKGAAFLSLVILTGSCQSEFEKYYEDPSWLEGNAYEVLSDKGNFTNYLRLVERTLYSQVIHGSGSYTFFAPNDEAFSNYLQLKGYQSVDDIPLEKASEIVSYSMVYNAYSAANLGNSWLGEWELGASFRKRTPSYKSLYKDCIEGDSVYVYDDIVNGIIDVWHIFRCLNIITPTYFAANNLHLFHYNNFFFTEFSFFGIIHDA